MSNFEGREIYYCDPDAFASGRGEIVIVSGSWWNFCGHALLHIIGYGYIHIAGLKTHPKLLINFHEFERYLSAYKKVVISRHAFDFPFPEQASDHFCRLMSEVWRHGGVNHNCGTLVREILIVGGVHEGFPGNCPIYSIDRQGYFNKSIILPSRQGDF